jgi:hypothetical protein
VRGPSTHIPKYIVTGAVSWLLCVFLILFPKGGIKIGPVPITWGYVILLLSGPALLPFRLLATPPSLRWSHLAAVAALTPFAAIFIYSYFVNGIGSFGFAASTFIGLTVLPLIFLLLYPGFYNRIDGRRLANTFRFCMLAAALFGIFLFIWHPITGHYIEIPYLTVNAEDYGQLEATKHIDRGLFFKLISTYNNGNVYGVATLILLPLFNLFEPKPWKRTVLKIALVLTLSRTVWIGLVLEQMLSLLRIGGRATATFPRIAPGPARRAAVTVLVTCGAIFLGFLLTARNLTFLFDTQLGGRSRSLDALLHPEWLPSVPVDGFSEIVYISALSTYGIIGLGAFILILLSPVLIWVADPVCTQSPVRRAALKGLVLYVFLAGMDGALNYIPMMAFYWFTYMIYLGGWPGSPTFPSSALVNHSTRGIQWSVPRLDSSFTDPIG